jgi:hypothetical protein
MVEAISQNLNFSNALGILGILVGYYFYLKSKPKTLLIYLMKETTIISVDGNDFSDKLEIRFDGVVVPRVTATKVVVWNAGNTSLEPKDFLVGRELKLSGAQDATVISTQIIKTLKPENLISLHRAESDSQLSAHFEVIRAGEGFVMDFLHTGANGSFKLTGSLKKKDKFIRREPMMFDSNGFITSPVPGKKFLFPLLLLAMTVFASALGGFFMYVLCDLLKYIVGIAVSNGVKILDIAFVTNGSLQYYLSRLTAVAIALFLVNDTYQSWRRRPASDLIAAYYG